MNIYYYPNTAFAVYNPKFGSNYKSGGCLYNTLEFNVWATSTSPSNSEYIYIPDNCKSLQYFIKYITLLKIHDN